ncbi:hypothetical protein [Methylobacterium sp. yr668]|uniref:hypothetical protein n=1 Tax=Methylobacterium sp. yr668 TaxID=1761801 RepID=UPI0008E064A0|nr:hypothetical protein [Methylobacterium sp. yr668]SFT26923.1 hypothetical protein SAMN04487845_13710 [Methylobacterium sp. yr668]
MGQAKREMMDHEETVQGVIIKLMEAGAAEECEGHGYPINRGDDEAVEQVKIDLAKEYGKDEADELVDEAVSQLYDECPGCAQNAKDD